MGIISPKFEKIRFQIYAALLALTVASVMGTVHYREQKAKIDAEIAYTKSISEMRSLYEQKYNDLLKKEKDFESEKAALALAAETTNVAEMASLGCNANAQEAVDEAKYYAEKREKLALQTQGEIDNNPIQDSAECEGQTSTKNLLKMRPKKTNVAKSGKCYNISYAAAMHLNREVKEEYFALQNAVYAAKECANPDNPFQSLANSSDIPSFAPATRKGVK